MKIYTKTGDQGETGLLGGARVSKSHLAIRVCGSLDETNSYIGLAISSSNVKLAHDVLTKIQHHLFDLGSHVAACLGNTNRLPEFPAARCTELEAYIDQIDGEIAPLKAFILPGGSPAGSTIHVARSICRRSERELVELIESGLAIDLSTQLVYLNRLGDLLFVLARYVNKKNDSPETEWDLGRPLGGDRESGE